MTFFFRYALNNAKYSVQRVAFLKGTQCQKFSFATRKITQNVMFKGLLSWKERNVKIFLCYMRNNAKYNVQRVAFLRGTQCPNLSFFRYTQNNAKYNVPRVVFFERNAMSKMLLRYARNNAEYSVQRVALCQDFILLRSHFSHSEYESKREELSFHRK